MASQCFRTPPAARVWFPDAPPRAPLRGERRTDEARERPPYASSAANLMSQVTSDSS
jgi:hypothetical protein